MGYLRNKTRPQGDRSILHKQINFGGGLNVDLPASRINRDELSNVENLICYDRYMEGRPGSVHAYDLAGSGDVKSIVYYKEGLVPFYHRGNQLFYGQTEVLGFPPTNLSFLWSEESEIKLYNGGKDALVFTSGGIYYVTLSYAASGGTARFFPIAGQPNKIAPNVGSAGDEYKYKYMFTFSCILDSNGDKVTSGNRYTLGNTLINETPPALPGGFFNADKSYWNLLTSSSPINSGNPMVISQTGLSDGSGLQHTHISWYRTKDTGDNGLNNQFDENFAWVGDQPIDDANFSDSTDDLTLQGRLSGGFIDSGYLPKNIGWIVIPGKLFGAVHPNFVLTADINGDTLYYCQTTYPELVGYYEPAYQFHKFQDQITALVLSKDILIVTNKDKTNSVTLTSYKNAGILETVNVLDHITTTDEVIGVRDGNSISEIEEGTFIALCSDYSVRLLEGNAWGRDYAKDKVKTIIREIYEGRSQSIYYKGAYYLFYNRDGSTNTKEFLRLSLRSESGRGWTKYTGDDLVLPPNDNSYLNNHNLLFLGDALDGTNRIGTELLYCIDKENDSGKIYWIETFDGPDGSTINGYAVKRYYGDKISSGNPNGTEILPVWKGQDVTGSQEAFKIIHQQSHTYIRPVSSTQLTRPTLYMDALAYIDGSLVSEETAGRIPYDGDIHFWYRVEGQRIAIEYKANRSGVKIVGTDTRYRVQDIARWSTRSSVTVGATFQRDFQQNITFWAASRPKNLVTLDRISQTKWTRNDLTTQTGPDGRSSALKVGKATGNNPYTAATKTTYDDEFTISFWCKDPDWEADSLQVLKIAGAASNPDLTIQFLNATTMRIKATNTVDVTVNDITGTTDTVNGYHHFVLVRQSGSTDVNVYQNDTLIDTVTFADTFGGGSTELGGVG